MMVRSITACIAALATGVFCVSGCTQASGDVDPQVAQANDQAARTTPSRPTPPPAAQTDGLTESPGEVPEDEPVAAPDPDAVVAANVLPVELAGMRFWPGRGWVREDPGSEMRAAQFRLPIESWDPTERDTDAQLVVYYFGEEGAGTTQAHIDRWLSQFEPVGDRLLDASIESVELNDLEGTIVRVRGTFVGETRPGSGEHRNEKGWAMVAIIVETDAGPYYARFIGPRRTIRRHELGITHMIDSIEAN